MGYPEKFFEKLKTKEDLNSLIGDAIERQYLEYKEVYFPSLFTKDGKNDKDRKHIKSNSDNFAVALSGFANSVGGVLIWGIKAKKEIPTKLCPFKHYRRFEADLMSMVGEWVYPSVDGLETKTIESSDAPGKGYVMALIPKSNKTPHMNRRTKAYYNRNGSSFCAMEHYQVEDMFGRRPKPKLEIYSSKIKESDQKDSYTINLEIVNIGRGTARDVYCGIKTICGKVNDWVESALPNGLPHPTRISISEKHQDSLLYQLGIKNIKNQLWSPVPMPPGMIFKVPQLQLTSSNPLVKITLTLFCSDIAETPINLYALLRNNNDFVYVDTEELPRIFSKDEIDMFCDPPEETPAEQIYQYFTKCE